MGSEVQDLLIRVDFTSLEKANAAYSALIKTGLTGEASLTKFINETTKALKARTGLFSNNSSVSDVLSKASFPKASLHPDGSAGGYEGLNAGAKAGAKADPLRDISKQVSEIEKSLLSSFKSGSSNLKDLMKELNIGSNTFVGQITDGFLKVEHTMIDIVGIVNSVKDISKGLGVLGSLLGFSSGGFTGSGNDYDIAGLAHKNEFIWPANITAKYMPVLDMLHKDNLKLSSPAINFNAINHSTTDINKYRPIQLQKPPQVIHVHISGAMDGQKFLNKQLPQFNNTQTKITLS